MSLTADRWGLGPSPPRLGAEIPAQRLHTQSCAKSLPSPVAVSGRKGHLKGGEVLECSFQPGESSFSLMTGVLGECRRGVRGLSSASAVGAVTPALAASLGHSEVQRGLRGLFQVPSFELYADDIMTCKGVGECETQRVLSPFFELQQKHSVQDWGRPLCSFLKDFNSGC